MTIHLPHMKIGPRYLWWSIKWKPQDAWIGAYWENYPGKVYIWVCIVPCFPLCIEWWKKGTGTQGTAAKCDKTTDTRSGG